MPNHAARRVACVAALALATAGCGSEQPEGAMLTVTVIGDAAAPGSLATRLVDEATRPTLVTRDGAGETQAGLATSWRFVDGGHSLILRLRPAKWSDGKAFQAREVVTALRRAAARRDGVIGDSGLAGADAILAGRSPVARLGVFAPISRVVELRLAAPMPQLLGWLAEPGLAVTRADATLAAYTVSGPAPRRVLTRRVMAATPDARPAAIIVAAHPDSDAAIADFIAGKVDVVVGDGLSGLGAARTLPRLDTLRIDTLWGVYGYRFNSARPALADQALRRALAMAVDRAALAAGFGTLALTTVEGPLPPGLADQAHAGASTNADADDWTRLTMPARRALAARLLAAAGITPTTPLRLTLLMPQGREHRRIAELVAADWAPLGVELAVSEVDSAARDRLVAAGDFDLAVSEMSVPAADASAFLARWRCSRSFCDRDFDTALAAARAADVAARPAFLAAAEARLIVDPPQLPLFVPVRWALVARKVEGWTPNRAASHPLARLAVIGGQR